MRLVGLALIDEHLRRELRRGLVWLRRRQRREASEAILQHLGRGKVVEVANQERAGARASPAPLAKGDDRLAGERAQVLLGTKHGPPQRVLAEGSAVDQVLSDRRGLVVG